jgi:hypothetical protein
MNLTKNQAHQLYQMAVDADVDYNLAIRAYAGPFATRWTLSREEEAHPVIARAYRHKVDADRTFMLHAQVSA